MSLISGIQFDLVSTCRSRGGVGEDVNFDPGRVEDSTEAEVNKLNDLIGLLKIQEELNAFTENVAENPLPGPVVARVIPAFASASGNTAFEKYLNALESVRNSDFFSGQSQGVKDRVDGLLGHLRAAQTQLQGLSPSALARLAVSEHAQQNLVGIALSLAAVNGLIDQMKTELDLAQDQLNEQAINARIASLCQAGVLIIAPPPPPPPPPPPSVAACSDGIDNDGDTKIDYPNDPGCTDANDNDETGWNEHRWVYGAGFLPAYRLLAYGSGDSALGSGPSLYLSGTLGYDISERVTLQADYRGYVNATNNFSSGRESQDFATVTVTYDPFIFQGSFLFERRNILTGENEWLAATEDEYLAALGFGAQLFDKLFYPFGGVLVGTSDGSTWGGGFYAGARITHEWEKYNLEVSGQALYSLLYLDKTYDHQAGLSAELAWSPTSFWGGNLQVGGGVGGGYDSDLNDLNFDFFLFLRWGHECIIPQPIRWGGY